MEENFLKAVIYFEDLNFEKISEEPMYDVSENIGDVYRYYWWRVQILLTSVTACHVSENILILVVTRFLIG